MGAPSFAHFAKGGSSDCLGPNPSRGRRSKRDLSPSFIHPHRSRLVEQVETIAAPEPFLRRTHQLPLHRIAMHISQFLYALLRSPYIEVVETSLPEWSAQNVISRQPPNVRINPLVVGQQCASRALFPNRPIVPPPLIFSDLESALSAIRTVSV